MVILDNKFSTMILTKIITTPKVQLLVIGGLPEDCVLAKHKYEKVHFRYKELDGSWVGYDVPGNWQPVGFLKDLNEDDAEKLVQKVSRQDSEDKYKNYREKYGVIDNWWSVSFDTAKESLLSLIESEVKLKNKYGELNYDHLSGIYRSEKGQADDEEWQTEQSEVFTNPFILIKK
jgi:hypothetical protein